MATPDAVATNVQAKCREALADLAPLEANDREVQLTLDRARDLLAMADRDGLERWDELRLGYTESMGDAALRIEIASLYERVTPDDVPKEGETRSFAFDMKRVFFFDPGTGANIAHGASD